MLGYLTSTGQIALPPDLDSITDPKLVTVAAVLYVIEFFADKAPGVDTGWDALHTFIRIPAGAVLAMGAMGESADSALHYPWLFLAALVLFILFSLWIIPRLWGGIQRVVQTVRRFF